MGDALYTVLVVGEDPFALSLIEQLDALAQMQVVGLVWTGMQLPAQVMVPLLSMEELGKLAFTDLILNTSPRQEVAEELARCNTQGFFVQGMRMARLFAALSDDRRELNAQAARHRQTREELNAVFNAAQEAIQVVDKTGTLTYINKAYTDITGILSDKRLGKSIMDVAPDGALAEVMRTKKSVFGHTMVTETGVDVMSNASPIIVDGEMTGAVVVFRDVSDMKKLARVLDMNKAELDSLKSGLNDLAAAAHTFDSFIGKDPEILKTVSLARKVAVNDTTVLITGESGTGKEVLAQAIHNYGSRAGKPFIGVNCAAIPEGLLESELFGHEKGAFTGATSAKAGKFELADKGTIFLDEIGDMEFGLQAKILRVLQEKEIERVGGKGPKPVDVKVIAATNRNLLEAVHKGTFRQDLYYRLNVIPLHLIPLRERGWDVVLLAEDILRRLNRRYGKNCVLDTAASRSLLHYSWPGNVRELENVLERAVLLAEGSNIGAELLSRLLHYGEAADLVPELGSLAETERIMIERALELYGNDMQGKNKAAQVLEISLSTLYNKMEKYGISKAYKRISKNYK